MICRSRTLSLSVSISLFRYSRLPVLALVVHPKTIGGVYFAHTHSETSKLIQSESTGSIRGISDPHHTESDTDNMATNNVQEITEGKAKVLLPKSVFYNPVQEFNRDLTTSIISQFAEEYLAEVDKQHKEKQIKKEKEHGTDDEQKQISQNSGGCESVEKTGYCPPEKKTGIRIFEGLAASGLRSIRFGLEVPNVKEVIANDFDPKAVEFIEKNIERNNLTGIVKSSHGDASMVMYQNKEIDKRFDVIDLDPYGSASQFLDASVQAVCEGGLLCVTCTDAAVLCGNAGETCFAKYGSLSLRAKYCHEMGLRILLQCIESHANRYSRYIVPLVSLSVDFYVRVFVRVYTGQRYVKMSVTKASMVYNCVGCGSFALQQMATAIPTKGDNYKFVPGSGPPVGPSCEHCGHKHQIGGPIWSAPIHNVEFLDRMLERIERDAGLFGTSGRMKGMLSVAREEVQDVPLYYILDDVCNILHCTPPNMVQTRSALLNAGYRVSLSHAAKNSYKTDAPWSVIWDIMRAWIKEHPVSAKRLVEGSVAQAILKKDPVLQISFEPHPDANPDSRKKGLVRWQKNPEPEWGPKPRARRCDDHETNVGVKTEDAKAGVKRPLDQEDVTNDAHKAPKRETSPV